MVAGLGPASLPTSASHFASRPAAARLTVAALIAGAAVTVAGLILPADAVASRRATVHVAVEVAAGLVVLLVCYLAWGRFRHSRQYSDLALTFAAGLLAGVNVLYSGLPSLLERVDPGWLTWTTLTGSLLAAAIFAAAAFAPDRRVRSVHQARLVLWCSWIAALAAIGLLGVLASPGRPTELAGARALLAAPALMLLAQGAGMVLYAVAAIGHWRRVQRTGDAMLIWLTAGLVLASFARLNYLLLPGLYYTWLYTGDLLRLGFYALLLAGAAREITAYWQDHAEVAVLQERRRLARELHDGLAQELAYIAAQARRLGGDQHAAQALAAAAERALDESRRAIAALTRSSDEPLEAALVREGQQVAVRAGTSVRFDVDSGLGQDQALQEAALRITREGIINAARHGSARQVLVEVRNDRELTLRITDDGLGFDPEKAEGRGFGLTSMRERAEATGGTFRIESSPGRGATVEVVWPAR